MNETLLDVFERIWKYNLKSIFFKSKGQIFWTGQIIIRMQFHKSSDERGQFCVWYTDNVHITEHKHSQIISIMTSTHFCLL